MLDQHLSTLHTGSPCVCLRLQPASSVTPTTPLRRHLCITLSRLSRHANLGGIRAERPQKIIEVGLVVFGSVVLLQVLLLIRALGLLLAEGELHLASRRQAQEAPCLGPLLLGCYSLCSRLSRGGSRAEGCGGAKLNVCEAARSSRGKSNVFDPNQVALSIKSS